jgi:hypothetical protein
MTNKDFCALLIPAIVACGGSVTDISDDGGDAAIPTDATIADGSISEASSPCGANEVLCGASCFPNDVNHCGASCTQCGAPALGKATCDGTQCGFTCNDLQCGSTCVDPSTNNTNCGGCGHDCLGTNCVNGQCAPELIYNELVDMIMVDGTNLYWNHPNEVREGPKAGGTALTLGTSQGNVQFAIDAHNVYWMGASAIEFAPIGGGTVSTLPTPSQPIGIAVDSNYIYYGDLQNTVEAPFDGGTPTVLLSMLTDTFEYSNGRLYYFYGNGTNTAFGDTSTVADAGNHPLYSIQNPHEFLSSAVDSANAYLGSDSDLFIQPLDGGSATSLAQGSVALVTSDSTNIYWVDQSGSGTTLYRTPIGAQSKTTLFSNALDVIGGIAVDNTYIYYALINNTPSETGIYRMVK